MRNNQFQIQNKSVAIITKSAVGGKSLVNILETAGIHSFSITREITGEFLDDLIKNPVDVLFVDSAFFTPSTEIHLNRVKDETNTKIILNVPILFPSLETKCIDAATSKPFKKANVLSTLHSIFHESAVSIHTSQENPESLHRSGKKGIGRDVFNDKFAQTSPLNILVAEDHKINQMLIKKVLSKLGYNPVIVENGKLAIEESLNTTYDVIFMDIQMPVLDGIAATKEIIKNWETHQKPFIIAMTANAMKGDREKYISSGMHDYISKPFLINDLLNMLKKYSEKKQSQIKNASLPRN
jgi:CheY-like chemotaxis protein